MTPIPLPAGDGSLSPPLNDAPMTALPTPEANAAPLERGAGLIFQKPVEAKSAEQSASHSALLYQMSAKEGGSGDTASRSALIDQTSAKGEAAAGVALTDTQGHAGEVGTGSTAGGGALLYQSRAASSVGVAPTDPLVPQDQAGTAATTAGDALLYQRAPASSPGEGAPPTAASPETSGGAAAGPQPDPRGPGFGPTSRIPARTLTSVRTAAGVSVPVVVASREGNWIGSATYDASLGRVDLSVHSFVDLKSGRRFPVQALGYQLQGDELTQGVMARLHPVAPTLGLDLARAALNSLNVYAQALGNAGTITTTGSMTTVTRQAPGLPQLLGGELGKLAQLPEGNQTIRVVADVASGTDVILLVGVAPSTDTP